MAKKRAIRKGNRRGVPFTVYLSTELSAALTATSKSRKVDKSTLVRTAIERLLADLESGQLNLPLGI
jgi:hypothetical protein